MPQDGHTDEFMADNQCLLRRQVRKCDGGRFRVRTCSTMAWLWSLMRSMIARAALFRASLDDFEATVRGYISACGWALPTSVSRLLIFRRILELGVWIRAMIFVEHVSRLKQTSSMTPYLRNNFQPCVHFNSREAIAHRVTDFVVGTELEPKGQKAQCILQSVLAAQRDGPEKACKCSNQPRYDSG